jgi:hypothetical protein
MSAKLENVLRSKSTDITTQNKVVAFLTFANSRYLKHKLKAEKYAAAGDIDSLYRHMKLATEVYEILSFLKKKTVGTEVFEALPSA